MPPDYSLVSERRDDTLDIMKLQAEVERHEQYGGRSNPFTSLPHAIINRALDYGGWAASIAGGFTGDVAWSLGGIGASGANYCHQSSTSGEHPSYKEISRVSTGPIQYEATLGLYRNILTSVGVFVSKTMFENPNNPTTENFIWSGVTAAAFGVPVFLLHYLSRKKRGETKALVANSTPLEERLEHPENIAQ